MPKKWLNLIRPWSQKPWQWQWLLHDMENTSIKGSSPYSIYKKRSFFPCWRLKKNCLNAFYFLSLLSFFYLFWVNPVEERTKRAKKKYTYIFLLQALKSFSHSLWLSALYAMPLLNQNSMLSFKMDLVCSNYIMMNTHCQIRNNWWGKSPNY
jgi:hypothetical protein